MSDGSCPMPLKTYQIVLQNKKLIEEKEITADKVGWGLWAGYGKTEITEEQKSYISVLKKQILERNPNVVKNNQIPHEMKNQIKIDLDLLNPIIEFELVTKDEETKKKVYDAIEFFTNFSSNISDQGYTTIWNLPPAPSASGGKKKTRRRKKSKRKRKSRRARR